MKATKFVLPVFLFIALVPAYAVVDYSIILKRNIFADPPPPPKPEILPGKTPIVKPPPPPTLSSLIELKGVIYFSDGGSFAVIKVRKKNEEVFYKEGDVVENAEIVKVNENEVVFLYNEKEERIELKKDSAQAGFTALGSGVSAKSSVADSDQGKGRVFNPVAVAAPKFEDPVTVNFEKTIADLKEDKELIKNLNVTPNIQGDEVDGFKINNIPAGSLLSQYGLQDGDVLRRVNGISINSVAKGFSVYNQIVREGTSLVTVEVLRNNTPVVLTFKLK